jgi:hypothetical protein
MSAWIFPQPARERSDLQKQSLAWLFQFQQLDAESIRIRVAQRQLQQLAFVQCCVAKAVLLTEWIMSPFSRKKGAIDQAFRERNDEAAFCKRVRRLTKAEVLEVHTWLRGAFRHGRPSRGEVDWAVPPRTEMQGIRRMTYPKLPYKVNCHQVPDEFRWLPSIDRRKGNKDVYLASIVELLIAFNAAIARCGAEECEEVFVRSGRQKFCSELCSSRTRSKAWYQRDPAAAREKANVRYHRWMEKKRDRQRRSGEK